MLYKTIILQMLEDRPAIYNRLKAERKSLATIEALASELKANQRVILADLKQANPRMDEQQLASQAMEMALADLESALDANTSPSPGSNSCFAEEETAESILARCIQFLQSQRPKN